MDRPSHVIENFSGAWLVLKRFKLHKYDISPCLAAALRLDAAAPHQKITEKRRITGGWAITPQCRNQ
jgi:hypothetical protein